jgi:uncharacterized lipoprotein
MFGGQSVIRFECDKCSRRLSPNDAHRFIVKIEAFAASGPMTMSTTDMERDHVGEMESLIQELNSANPDDVEDLTYRSFRYDLCSRCHRAFLANPLG